MFIIGCDLDTSTTDLREGLAPASCLQFENQCKLRLTTVRYILLTSIKPILIYSMDRTECLNSPSNWLLHTLMVWFLLTKALWGCVRHSPTSLSVNAYAHPQVHNANNQLTKQAAITHTHTHKSNNSSFFQKFHILWRLSLMEGLDSDGCLFEPQSIVNVRMNIRWEPIIKNAFFILCGCGPKSGPWWQRRFEHKPTDCQTHSPPPNCEETNCNGNGLCLGRHAARKQARGVRTPCGQTPRRPRYPKLAPQTRM